MPRILIVTAVVAERDAVLAGRDVAIGAADGIEVHRASTAAGLVDVIAGGVGSIAAALATASALKHGYSGYDLVISTGIAGGFAPMEIGAIAVASAVVHADLGADSPAGFTSMADLGWGAVRFDLDAGLTEDICQRSQGFSGSVLTVSTVTGSAKRAAALCARYPDAVAEGMEGVGVYRAALAGRVPFTELRAISNRVGPRNTDEWRIGDALISLSNAFDAVLSEPLKAGAAL
jgi:futalosine hydrolase